MSVSVLERKPGGWRLPFPFPFRRLSVHFRFRARMAPRRRAPASQLTRRGTMWAASYGTVADQAEVLPDSKPSAKTTPSHQSKAACTAATALIVPKPQSLFGPAV